MTRAQTLAKMAKLRAVTEARGATPGEADAARRRLRKLGERLAADAPSPPPPAQPVPVTGIVAHATGLWVPLNYTTNNTQTPFWITFS